ncbi:DUF5676 family membrane protein [Nitrospinota bacterium]
MVRFSAKQMGLAGGLLFAISYVLCVGWGLVVPAAWQMYPAWERLLPGFSWLTPATFALGLAETFLYGLYAGALFAVLCNLFRERPQAA